MTEYEFNLKMSPQRELMSFKKEDQDPIRNYPRLVPTERDPPETMKSFFNENNGKDISDILGITNNDLFDKFVKRGSQFQADAELGKYNLRLIDNKNCANVWRCSALAVMLYVHEEEEDERDLPLGISELEFYKGSPVITQVQGVRASKSWIDYNVIGMLGPLKWRHLLIDSAYQIGRQGLLRSNPNVDGKVYLLSAQQQQWLNSHHAPREAPFDLNRAKMTIDRPARDVGFRDKDSTGMLFRRIIF